MDTNETEIDLHFSNNSSPFDLLRHIAMARGDDAAVAEYDRLEAEFLKPEFRMPEPIFPDLEAALQSIVGRATDQDGRPLAPANDAQGRLVVRLAANGEIN